MRKQTIVHGASLLLADMAALRAYAERHFDGNLSLATRKLLRAGLEVLAPDLIAKEEGKGE